MLLDFNIINYNRNYNLLTNILLILTRFENYYENAHDYLNVITGEDLINIKFPPIAKAQMISKVFNQFMFIINIDYEMSIKEAVGLHFCLPPPEYIYHAMEEFKKLPGFYDDNSISNETYIRIPEFGV